MSRSWISNSGSWSEVSHTHSEADLPPSMATEAEATTIADSAITAHEAKANPHPTYATDADLAAHAAAANPHPTYATDADLSAHVAAANPHPLYATDVDLTNHVNNANPHPASVVSWRGNAAGATIPSGNGQNLVFDVVATNGAGWVVDMYGMVSVPAAGIYLITAWITLNAAPWSVAGTPVESGLVIMAEAIDDQGNTTSNSFGYKKSTVAVSMQTAAIIGGTIQLNLNQFSGSNKTITEGSLYIVRLCP